MWARYFDLIGEMQGNTYNHRLRLVESARERGIKPTARLFATTVPTVGKWLRRFLQGGASGLREQSRARHRQPHKTPSATEAVVNAEQILKKIEERWPKWALRREAAAIPPMVAVSRDGRGASF